MLTYASKPLEFTAFFPFCGFGGGARGFLDAQVRLFGRDCTFRSLGGIDIDQESCLDFEMLTGSPALCADVSTLTPAELRAFCSRTPDAVFSSPPCKGFSGLLSKKAAKKARYRTLNRLALDWIETMLAAWDEPPRLVLIENVPRIQSRGEKFLKAIRKLLGKAGYVFTSQTHDCGELGGLAQRRRRYLLVARHPDRCPPFLYQPRHRRVKGCGEVIGKLPMPGDPAAGPLHQLPQISWLNWIRLGLIPAGGDWRDLPGVLEEHQARREVHKRHGVLDWDEPASTVAGSGSNGATAIADPRIQCAPRAGVYGVRAWDDPSKTVVGAARIDNGPYAVADPRIALSARPGRHQNKYRVGDWSEPVGAVIGATRPGSGAPSIADPRAAWHRGVLGVRRWGDTSGTITGRASPSTGAFSVADPRVRTGFDHAFRVLGWREPSFTIAGKTSPGCGAYQVADPRLPGEGLLPIDEAVQTLEGGPWTILNPETGEIVTDIVKPKRAPSVAPVILARDGTWHRPLTTLELAVLQGLPPVIDGRPLELAGTAVSRWRERIGNAVPVQAAEAIAEQMLITLAETKLGLEDVEPKMTPVWVEPDRSNDDELLGL